MATTLQETHHLASLSSLSPQSPDDPLADAPSLANLPPELQDVLRSAAADGTGPSSKLRDLLAQHATQPQEAQEIVPLKGYVIKTALAKSTSVYPSGMKLFINVTHSPYVPAPPMATDDEIKQAIAEMAEGPDADAETVGTKGSGSDNKEMKPAWRVPMSLSEVRDDLDKAGRPCLVVDALVNTSVVQKSEKSPDFRAFVIELALSWVEAKHKMTVSRECTIPNMQCKGDPVAHKIYRAKRAGIADTDAVKQTPLFRVRRSAAVASTAAATRPTYTITIQLPLLFTADKVDLHIEERKVLLDHPLYAATIPLSCTVDVDSDECDAAFDKSKRELIVKVPILGSLPLKQQP